MLWTHHVLIRPVRRCVRHPVQLQWGEGEIWGNGTAPPYIFGPPGAYTFEVATGIHTPASGDTPQTPIVSYYNGDVGFQVVVPEPSTWAMMILGFAGLGFAGHRKSRDTVSVTA
jgi:hypothetical protein